MWSQLWTRGLSYAALDQVQAPPRAVCTPHSVSTAPPRKRHARGAQLIENGPDDGGPMRSPP